MKSVLFEISQYADGDKMREFSLTFVKTNGELRHRERMTNGGRVSKPGAQPFYNMKAKAAIMLFNVQLNRYESILLPLITHYNGIRIWH